MTGPVGAALRIPLGLGSDSAHLIFSNNFIMSPLFAQIKDAVALCELFNWLEKEVGSQSLFSTWI